MVFVERVTVSSANTLMLSNATWWVLMLTPNPVCTRSVAACAPASVLVYNIHSLTVHDILSDILVPETVDGCSDSMIMRKIIEGFRMIGNLRCIMVPRKFFDMGRDIGTRYLHMAVERVSQIF